MLPTMNMLVLAASDCVLKPPPKPAAMPHPMNQEHTDGLAIRFARHRQDTGSTGCIVVMEPARDTVLAELHGAGLGAANPLKRVIIGFYIGVPSKG